MISRCGISSRTMPDNEIDYFALTQDAMRGVVRGILQRVLQSGLPGEHHFYISFRTGAPGVMLSKRLRERYPGEMTIVLQHRFSNLLVFDDRFEVTLSFDSIPERLAVPFLALKAFFDPHARFAHQFEPIELPNAATERPSLVAAAKEEPAEPVVPAQPVRRPRVRTAEDKKRKPAALAPTPAQAGPVLKSVNDTKHAASKPAAVKPAEAGTAAAKPADPAAANKVVELDAFRKKPN